MPYRRLCGLLLLALVGHTLRAAELAPTGFPDADAVVYREGLSEPLRLFIVKPKDWKSTDRRPALIFFFGGGWTTGTPNNTISWARWAAAQGMIGIAPDYRTKNRYDTSPLASVADSRAALHWVQGHAAECGLDPSRVVVAGNSAGGHVALWTGITHSPPGSAADEAPRIKPAALVLFSTVSDTSLATGYTPQRFGDDAAALSPIHQLDRAMPPVLAFHGDADTTVPLRQATALRDQLIASGNICELHIVPGGSHNFGRDLPGWYEKSLELMLDFFARHGVLPPAPAR